MKKIKSELILAGYILIVCSMILGGCKKKESTSETTDPIPFQGPKNPSFETLDDWVTFTGSSTSRVTGTGFLPSQGVYYASFYYYSGGTSGIQLYQDGVDLRHSTTMTFDYTFTCNHSTGVQNTSTAKILFTSNGTVTLWEKTIDSLSTLPIQVLNNTITLPATTAAGRLLIQGSAISSNGSYQTSTFCIDNIRVH